MSTKTRKRNRRTPEVVYRNNKPVSVILDIAEYNKMLERLEDVEDIKFIENLKSKQLKFRKLDDFLADHNSNV
ncbi:MAG: type II toxin-antitoxin system Phd/YefM family antitoxin [Bacteroidetes bacterium]|nr:type II toxin-antitoxin system Phd/YefM family antitoxin [Bacteroidota bacterium]